MKNRIFETLSMQGFLPLVTKIKDKRAAEIIVEAAHAAGIKTIEYAARSENAADIFSAIAAKIRKEKYDILLGAGSMLNAAAAKTYHSLGADYIVSPHTDEEIAAYCNERELFWIPGASTLNEIIYATKLGAGIIKIFPADLLGGPAFAKAIMAPVPHLKLMPTGGITLNADSLKAWFDCGVVCVGVGSNLFSAEQLNNPSVQDMQERFAQLRNLVRQVNIKK